MRRVLSLLVLLASGLAVSACGLLPFPGGVFDSSEQTADARMEQIADALNSHDPVALKDMFSPYALEKATGIDDGLEYLLSFFPNSRVTWEQDAVRVTGHSQGGRKSTVLLAYYELSVDGKDYKLFFADFTVNDVENPNNVGLYAMGVTPSNEAGPKGDPGFDAWAGGIGLTSDGEYGYPGVYVPRDEIVYPTEQSDARMEHIVAAVNSRDSAALTAMFSARALGQVSGLDQRLADLLGIFPNGGLTWERYTVNSIGDDARMETKLLTAFYTVSADGMGYRLFFADFAVDANDPENVGLASLAVTPWFEPGSSDEDQAYIDWTSSWGHDADGLVGIYVPTG